MDSRVELKTTNGGIKLTRMAGDVEGHTTNGGIDVNLEGNKSLAAVSICRRRMAASGWVRVEYNAHLEAGTTNGSVRIDFPAHRAGHNRKVISADLGSGGATLRVRTSNGGVVTKK